MKPGSITQVIRLVTNSNGYQKNGSINSHVPKGASLIGNLKSIFTRWRLGSYFLVLDLARADRSIFRDKTTNQLRLMW